MVKPQEKEVNQIHTHPCMAPIGVVKRESFRFVRRHGIRSINCYRKKIKNRYTCIHKHVCQHVNTEAQEAWYVTTCILIACSMCECCYVATLLAV